MHALSTDALIEQFVAANCGGNAHGREAYVLRQALQGLVRQAKVEQISDMRMRALRLAGVEARQQLLRRVRGAQGWPARQCQLEFDEGEPGAA